MAGTLVLMLAASWPLIAQESPGATGGEEDPSPAARQEVDEEEAAFRRRMELEEGDEGDLPADLDPPDIVEVDPEAGPVDRLPPRSREHLEAQLTELIIENGRWEPADAARDAPFEPSEAARADPELAAAEAEAWQDMVAAYHERERAAFERAGGRSAGQDTNGNGSAGAGHGTGSGPGGGQGRGNGQGSGAGAGDRSSGAAGERAERPPEGEPFSALEFLGGKTPAQAPPSEEELAEEPPAVEGAAAPVSQFPATPPDTGDAADPPTSANTDDSSAAPSPETPPATDAAAPGSVPVEAIGGLFGPGVAADDGSTSGARERGDPPDAAQGEPSGQPERSSPADPPGPTSDSAPPRRSFWDWLTGLFRGDEDPPGG